MTPCRPQPTHELLHVLSEHMARTCTADSSPSSILRTSRLCCKAMRTMIDAALRQVTVRCADGARLLRSALGAGRLSGLRRIVLLALDCTSGDVEVTLLELGRHLPPHLAALEVCLVDMSVVAGAVAALLGGGGRLTSLHIYDSRFDAGGASALADGMAGHAAAAELRTLVVIDCEFGAGALHELARGVAALASLEGIWVEEHSCSRGQVKPRGQALAAAVQGLRCLHTMHLSNVCVGLECARTLARSLEDLTRLTQLDLNGNGFGAAGMAPLAPAIARLPLLQVLNLDFNFIGDEGLQELAGATAGGGCQSLRSLNLACNAISDAAPLCAWTASAPGRSGLTALVLSSNSIAAGGMQGLVTALKLAGAAQLWCLDLSDTDMAGAGADELLALQDALTSLRSMRRLFMCMTVPEDARHRLRAALPWVDVIEYAS